ncbi:hypothetical protein DLM76_08315 [Leptospira yasudae]|uniref:Uncharacterized protein n=1 Tax=Leptospira yasudae TaxID=2202201 RepID=A0ABX9LXW7_9LEPT|nr:hypothetical protein DLM77_20610 [Leptospira yasudae]RHX95297.1 hypothetical protein DLM76_08315 [Leptospira yasudae]
MFHLLYILLFPNGKFSLNEHISRIAPKPTYIPLTKNSFLEGKTEKTKDQRRSLSVYYTFRICSIKNREKCELLLGLPKIQNASNRKVNYGF